MKRIFPLLLILLSFLNSKAQYVEIPDSNFRKILEYYSPNCMSNGKLDTLCAAPFYQTLDVSSKQIYSLEGIQYLKSLWKLDCTKNKLSTLPALPPNLLYLDCNSNQLIALPSLPSKLIELNCGYNQLEFLPELPKKLNKLYCYYNKLLTIPILPESLKLLYCQNNPSLKITTLGDSLETLDISSCNLDYLPPYPEKLRSINCSNNFLTSIPNYNENLREVNCSKNLITALPEFKDSLRGVNCSNNLLTFLPSFNDSLTSISCSNNYLTSLPDFPPKLNQFYCSNNFLTSLPTLHDNIIGIDCSNNLLVELPKLPNKLQVLYCDFNKLNSLPKLPNSLLVLTFSNNQITYLPILPAQLYFLNCGGNLISTISNLNNSLQYLDVRNSPLTCLTELPWSVNTLYIKNTLLLCMPQINAGFVDTLYSCENPEETCPLNPKVTGKLYVDLNKNGKKDVGESSLPYSMIQVMPNGSFSTSSFNGEYLSILDKNTSNTWSVVSSFHYGSFNPNNFSSTPTSTSIDSISYDFGLQLRPNIPDLEVSVASGPARPGFVNNFTATIHNLGTINQSGITLKIKKPSELSFISAEPAPNSSFGDTIVWNNLALTLFESKTFNIQFQMPATADLLGTPLNYKAIVSPISIDSTPANNTATWTETVRGSYDPNDKLVNSQNLSPSYTSKDKLLYTIRFQNTGTDTAFTVIVRDELPDNLDASSVRMVNSSHPCAFLAREKNILEFVFSNILLVDSATNEPKSHGFVQLEVKPIEGLVIDDSIKNKASIFFDYNEPIITPNALTVVKEITTGIASNKNLLFSIYPNPSKSNFIVALPNEEGPAVWMLTDISGRTVKNGMVNNIGKTLEFSVADVSSGTYIFSLQMNGEISSAKLVVVK